MPVPDRMREIESEIDAAIRDLPIWRASRPKLIESLVTLYRDAMELVFANFLHAKTFDLAEGYSTAFGLESRYRAGALWTFKWASEYCSADGLYEPTVEELVDVFQLGSTYETFVDALKSAGRGDIAIAITDQPRVIEFYEGGSLTGFDAQIVEHQRLTTPTTWHTPLTDDGDCVTARWTAGDYRRVTRNLASLAAGLENTIVVDATLLAALGKPEVSIPQPTVVWIDRPAIIPDCFVFDDLTLPETIDSKSKWKLVSLLDTPILQVGNRFCAVSSDLKAVSIIDDYMLRVAARIDPDTYAEAATLREERMITICRPVLERHGWSVDQNVIYKNPKKEADIVATKGAETLILQLKSTLRPETPWEVYKRNQGLVGGIEHTRALLDRTNGSLGFVLTDGYRGDFRSWAVALARQIPIATLDDIEIVSSDPAVAMSELQRRVGIPDRPCDQPAAIPDREADLMGWRLRFLDRPVPQAL